jgi:alcohol dehydrogenase
MAGSVRALDLAYQITRRGGTTVSAGLSPPDATFALPHVNLVAEERTLKGSYLGSCVPTRDVPRYVEWFRAGRLPVDRLIDARLELEQVNDALDRMASGLALRQVLMLG